jgi:AAA+ ATPase superfamily predicted ATPase
MLIKSNKLHKESHLRKKMKIVETQERIKNPYVTGMPLHSSEMFYGREQVLEKIASNFLPSSENNIFALCGQRRIGKTSVLYQLRNRVLNPDYCVGVVIDLSMYGLQSDAELLDTIAYGIDLELYPKHVTDSSPKEEKESDASLHSELVLSPEPAKEQKERLRTLRQKEKTRKAFNAFLDSVSYAIGGRRLVLLFDEVEWLFYSIEAGRLTAGFLESFLKMIIEREDIGLMFTSKESFTSLLSALGLSAPKTAIEVIKIGHLSKETTFKLITEPCFSYLSYDDNALEMIFRQTDGHPYLTQCLCYHIVKKKNSSLSLGAGKKGEVKKSDFESVKHDFMRTVEGHFEDLFYDWTTAEKLWMSAVASLSRNYDEWVSEEKVLEHLSFYPFYDHPENRDFSEVNTKVTADVPSARRIRPDLSACNLSAVAQAGAQAGEEQLKMAADSLIDAELLEKDGPFYRSRIGILTEWLAKYHPLEETIGKKL